MKILMLSGLDIKYKSIQVIRLTPEAYAEAGHQVYFVTFRDRDPSGDYSYEPEGEFSNPNAKIIRLSLPDLGSYRARGRVKGLLRRIKHWILFPLLAAWRGWMICAKEQVDVIYGYEVYGVLAARLLRPFLLGTKSRSAVFVHRFQGTKASVLLDLTGVERFKRAIHLLDHLIALRAPADLAIMTNDGTRGDIVLDRVNPRLPRVRFWMNGVDIQPRPRDMTATPQTEEVTLLTVSRLVRWKRVDRVLCAFEIVRRRFPRTKLVVVGDGGERPHLEELSRQLGLTAAVQFVGAVPHTLIPGYFTYADIFISAYELSNLGNPLLEALASGVPVVTLDDGSTEGLLEHMDNALLVPVDKNIEQNIAEAVIQLLDNKQLRTELGERGPLTVKEKCWTWSQRLRAEVECVESLVKP